MRLIGLTGYKEAGKDTVYGLIRSIENERKVERASFADKMKVMAARALGFQGSDIQLVELMNIAKSDWQLEIAENGRHIASRTGREYLQCFGGEARKVFWDDFWVDLVLPKAEQGVSNQRLLTQHFPNANIVCVTDVRYPNEAQRVLDLGGEIWLVKRPGIVSDGHESEQRLPYPMIDKIINNAYDIEWLRRRVKLAL